MKKLLINFSIFILSIALCLTGLAIYYAHLSGQINNQSSENNIFIWGDSQANKGFDLPLIESVTGKQVYSAARGGAGVYDFLVFVETVPEKSTVILSISQLAQIRGRDKNNSGIPLKHLLDLYINNFEDLLPSIRNNIYPKPLYLTSTELYPYRDTLTFHEPITKFEEIYFRSGDQYKDKQCLFFKGIEYLKEKNCRIYLVEFPFHPMLSEVMSKSPLDKKTKDFNREILNLFNPHEIKNIQIHSSIRMMYDLTHLNENGAYEVTSRIFTIIKNDSNQNITRLFTINNGICE